MGGHASRFRSAVTPIVQSVRAGDTPLPALLTTLESPFILEGFLGGWFDGKYTLIGLPPFALFQSYGQESRFTVSGGGTLYEKGDPLVLLQNHLNRFKPDLKNSLDLDIPGNLPFLHGGAAGFIRYDLIRQYEPIPRHREESLPDIYMAFINHFILFHPVERTYDIVYNPAPLVTLGEDPETAYRIGQTKIEAVSACLTTPRLQEEENRSPFTVASDLSEREYVTMVQRAQAYIAAGDIFQANLAQSFRAPFHGGSLLPIYQRLRQINPSPFAAYLNMGGIEMAGASPERLMRIQKGAEGTTVETRPIAGTRPRGFTFAEDQDQITMLYGSEKERAEHLMLVDLERNDLGKVCRFGSVKVDALLTLERYSHVFHLVSNIIGTLRESVHATDVLRALFPGGTITGVPKIRCMQIIAELEKESRGIYTGSVGYFDFNGECDMNIVIRTIVRQGDTVSFHVGAGIVADSDPAMEYQETLQKAAALFNALEPF